MRNYNKRLHTISNRLICRMSWPLFVSSLSQSDSFKEQIPNYVRMRRRQMNRKKLNQNKYAINVYNRLNMRSVRCSKRRLAANGGKNYDRPLHKHKFSQTLAIVLLFKPTSFFLAQLSVLFPFWLAFHLSRSFSLLIRVPCSSFPGPFSTSPFLSISLLRSRSLSNL